MKTIALLVLLCTFPGIALGNSTVCKSISKASDRLACYDKASLRLAVNEPSDPIAAQNELTASKTPAGRRFADMLTAENSKLTQKLKTICRGC